MADTHTHTYTKKKDDWRGNERLDDLKRGQAVKGMKRPYSGEEITGGDLMKALGFSQNRRN